MLRKLSTALLLLIVTIPQPQALQAQTSSWVWPSEWLADTAFLNTWARPDAPVALQSAPRSWLWGPTPFAVANEPYAESPTGLRLVEYLDKGRMEINDPTADRSSPWFVTSGLLVNEMVTGQIQTGNATFQPLPPSTLPVAGDPTSPNAPTYTSFASHTSPVSDLTGQPLTGHISLDGSISPYSPPGDPAPFASASYDPTSGHNIPRVFADWMAQTGPILDHGTITHARLLDPLYLLGHPITEPYWADILISGKPATILIQLYERRALTYNPDNPPEWRVEMANVGRAYYDWRYSSAPPTPAIALDAASNSLTFRGYNWTQSSLVHIDITLAGAVTPLVGPEDLTADAHGRFAATMLPTDPLLSAIQSGANLRAHAEGSGTSIALPFALGIHSGQTRLSGTLIGFQTTPDSYNLIIRDFGGKATTVQLSPNTHVRYSEDTPAQPSFLDIGQHLYIEGTPSPGGIRATSVRLMSLSSTLATLGYQWTSDARHILVSGTGWPHETTISFTLDPTFTDDPQPADTISPPTTFATLRTDSRGDLQGTLIIPAFTNPLWLSAIVQDNSVKLYAPIAPAATPIQPDPPQLSLASQQGAQLATHGSLCWQGFCILVEITPLPTFALPVKPGETLALRSQYGPNPNLGLTPLSYSATIYPNPRTTNPPIYTSTNSTGRPFSLTLPSTLLPGKYDIILTVTWPDPTGSTSNTTYGFTIQIN